MPVGFNKKIIIIGSLIITMGVASMGVDFWQQYQQRQRLSQEEILKSPKEKIISYRLVAENDNSLVSYNYISERQALPETYKGLTEDMGKRTSNSQSFLKDVRTLDDGSQAEEYVAKFYAGQAFAQEGENWYFVKTATTTPQAFAAQTRLTLVDRIKEFFGQRTFAATEIIYAGSQDGYIYYSSAASWDEAHDAAAGTAVFDYLIEAFVGGGREWFGNTYTIFRAFFPIDTSSLPDDAVISAATLYLTPKMSLLAGNPEDFVVVVQSTQASPLGLVVEDYDQCGTINNPIEGSNRMFNSDIAIETYSPFVLNETGQSWISLTGYTLLGVRHGNDVLDLTTLHNEVSFYTSEDDQGTKDPYLEVTYNITYVKDYEMALTLNGQVIPGSDNKATGSDLPNGNLDYVTYGGPGDNWGTNLTAADINNSSFGVSYQVEGDGAISESADVDSIEVTVYYDVETVIPGGQVMTACQTDADCPSGESCFIEQRYGLSGWAWNQIQGGSGLGWIEFGTSGFTIPPWLQTKYGDIYAKEGLIGQEPPSYNATYRILSGGGIVNFKSARGQEWISPDFGPINFPTPETRYSNILGKLDIDSQLCDFGTRDICVNQFGRTVVKVDNQSDITQPLMGRIYYRDGDLTINNFIEFMNSTDFVNAAGTVIVNGNLTINAGSNYDDSDALTRFRNLASVAWIVKGDLYISPSVSDLAGNFIVIGNGQSVCDPGAGISVPGCGEIHTCYNSTACKNRLTVSGLMMARKFFLDREFPLGDQEASIKGSELIIYDGRLLANTPPGMADFAESLPIWRSETFSR